jgi:hypothetical protein
MSDPNESSPSEDWKFIGMGCAFWLIPIAVIVGLVLALL